MNFKSKVLMFNAALAAQPMIQEGQPEDPDPMPPADDELAMPTPLAELEEEESP